MVELSLYESRAWSREPKVFRYPEPTGGERFEAQVYLNLWSRLRVLLLGRVHIEVSEHPTERQGHLAVMV